MKKILFYLKYVFWIFPVFFLTIIFFCLYKKDTPIGMFHKEVKDIATNGWKRSNK
jgi:hypothetical protein